MLSPLQRAGLAAQLVAKVAERRAMPAPSGGAPDVALVRQRARLAGEINALRMQLGGAGLKREQARVLADIAEGRRDGESLAELYGLIQEAVGELMDGGEAVLDSVAGPGDAEALEAALRIKAGELSALPPSAGDPLRRAILAQEVAGLLAQLGGEGPFAEARAYFKEHLQGTTVQTVAGPVRIIGTSWKEMRRGMKSDGLRAALIPHVIEILTGGNYHGREPLNKQRDDPFVAFHFFEKTVNALGMRVTAGVNVGERADGMLVYGLGHEFEARWAKRRGAELSRGREPRGPAPGESVPALDAIMGQSDRDGNEKPAPLLALGKEPRVEAGPDDVSAILDATVVEEGGGVNVVILAVYDADGARHPELEDAAGMP